MTVFLWILLLWDGVSFCKTNISYKELFFSQYIEWTKLVSKTITDGNLKNLDWENCLTLWRHAHINTQNKKLDYFIPFLLMTTIDPNSIKIKILRHSVSFISESG